MRADYVGSVLDTFLKSACQICDLGLSHSADNPCLLTDYHLDLSETYSAAVILPYSIHSYPRSIGWGSATPVAASYEIAMRKPMLVMITLNDVPMNPMRWASCIQFSVSEMR